MTDVLTCWPRTPETPHRAPLVRVLEGSRASVHPSEPAWEQLISKKPARVASATLLLLQLGAGLGVLLQGPVCWLSHPNLGQQTPADEPLCASPCQRLPATAPPPPPPPSFVRVILETRIESHVGLPVHGACFSLCLCPVSYTHLTLPTTCRGCRSRWSPYH